MSAPVRNVVTGFEAPVRRPVLMLAVLLLACASTQAAQTRAERALAARRTPDEIDIRDLNAQLEALLDGAAHG